MNKQHHFHKQGIIHGACFLLAMLCLSSLFIATTGKTIGIKRSLAARQSLRKTARQKLFSLQASSRKTKEAPVSDRKMSTTFSLHHCNESEIAFIESSNHFSTIEAIMVTKAHIKEFLFRFRPGRKPSKGLTSARKESLRKSLHMRACTAQKNFENLSTISPAVVRQLIKSPITRQPQTAKSLSFAVSEREKEKAIAQVLFHLKNLQSSEDFHSQDIPEQKHHQQSG